MNNFTFLSIPEVNIQGSVGWNEQSKTPTPSITSFACGSGLRFKKITFDYALKYDHIRYNHPDLFPVEGEFRPDLDIVNDSKIILLGTLTYNFKW